jgi:hypothetical protein
MHTSEITFIYNNFLRVSGTLVAIFIEVTQRGKKSLKDDKTAEPTEDLILCILNCDSIVVILYHGLAL